MGYSLDEIKGKHHGMAAGGEQMSASIREISETMSKSKANAAEATGRIDAADHHRKSSTRRRRRWAASSS